MYDETVVIRSIVEQLDQPLLSAKRSEPEQVALLAKIFKQEEVT